MKWNKLPRTSLILISMAFLILSVSSFTKKPSSIQYRTYNAKNSLVHTLVIPFKSQYKISLAFSEQVKLVEDFAKNSQAVAVLNAGFLTPKIRKRPLISFKMAK